ncbi:MAG: ATP-dependent DNA helicase [Oscillospiraceae bacterium]|jgi:Rad3-related DNA helicase|nr:ATP-dependent DNA helicase [Oscillospiraceae bacterium]
MLIKKLSARELAESASRSGDIDARRQAGVKPLEGARLHRLLQSLAGDGYKPEVTLKTQCIADGVCFQVSGRADGIITADGGVAVDEIKTTLRNIDAIEDDLSPAHRAQAMIYAYIYCELNSLDEISTQLTYCQADSGKLRRIVKRHTRRELTEWFVSLLTKLVRWARFEDTHRAELIATAANLPFPYGEFRGGQRKLARAVYVAVRDGTDLFADAPTGLGKTMAALYPAVRALGKELAAKAFYLTAKETGRAAAYAAAKSLCGAGLLAKTVVITARDKICPLEIRQCDPERCERARGHYDRVDDAAYDALRGHDLFPRELISELAERHCVCPFELSLDLALYADIIICDYNYAFDPTVRLQRFFADGARDYVFLCDEAHSLPDRARDMYSAELKKSSVLAAKKTLPKSAPSAAKTLRSAVNAVSRAFLAIRESAASETFVSDEVPDKLPAALSKLTDAVSLYQADGGEVSPALLDLFFGAQSFLRAAERFSERYAAITRVAGADVSVKLFCADPSAELRERLEPARAAVFFSATLTPSDYFAGALGARDGARFLKLPSPFPAENFLPVALGFVSARYRDRQKSKRAVADIIAISQRSSPGNRIAFFPSYGYMREVFEEFLLLYSELPYIIQSPGMTVAGREEFIAKFGGRGDGFTAFCVLGGVFSEGIDLVGEDVVGITIVGTGLPGIDAESEILREKFGYDTAYTYPGLQRVLQAAGRLIRTENDRGAVVFADDRFTSARYRALFPEHYAHMRRARNPGELKNMLREFADNGRIE